MDEVACKRLYDLHANFLYSVCLRYAKNTEEAKDLLQDAFIRIFEKIHTYSGKGSLKGWMRKVTVNVALRSCQKLALRPDKIGLEEYHENLHFDLELLESIDVKELHYFINSLSDGRRQVFNAFVIEGYSHKEIAQQMGISEGTSKSQLFDAKKELRRFMKEQLAITLKKTGL